MKSETNDKFYVYIASDQKNTTLYTGVCTNMERRLLEHKLGLLSKYTNQVITDKLIFYEIYPQVEHAMYRMKELENLPTDKKIDMITKANLNFDLTQE